MDELRQSEAHRALPLIARPPGKPFAGPGSAGLGSIARTSRPEPVRPAARLAPRPVAKGITLIGLVFYALVIGFAAYVAIRVVPTVVEFYAIRRAIDHIAAAPPSTVGEIRSTFDKQRAVDFDDSALTGHDLDITKENDKVVIRYHYKSEVELVGPVHLVILYGGESR